MFDSCLLWKNKGPVLVDLLDAGRSPSPFRSLAHRSIERAASGDGQVSECPGDESRLQGELKESGDSDRIHMLHKGRSQRISMYQRSQFLRGAHPNAPGRDGAGGPDRAKERGGMRCCYAVPPYRWVFQPPNGRKAVSCMNTSIRSSSQSRRSKQG